MTHTTQNDERPAATAERSQEPPIDSTARRIIPQSPWKRIIETAHGTYLLAAHGSALGIACPERAAVLTLDEAARLHAALGDLLDDARRDAAARAWSRALAAELTSHSC
jgi:hypothetical protein